MKKLSFSLLAALSLGAAQAQTLTVYVSRGEGLVQPIIKDFEKDTRIKVSLRFGPDAEILAALQEEGSRSPKLDFSNLTDLDGTRTLLREVEVL